MHGSNLFSENIYRQDITNLNHCNSGTPNPEPQRNRKVRQKFDQRCRYKHNVSRCVQFFPKSAGAVRLSRDGTVNHVRKPAEKVKNIKSRRKCGKKHQQHTANHSEACENVCHLLSHIFFPSILVSKLPTGWYFRRQVSRRRHSQRSRIQKRSLLPDTLPPELLRVPFMKAKQFLFDSISFTYLSKLYCVRVQKSNITYHIW